VNLLKRLKIRREGDTLARSELGKLLGDLVADVSRTRRDINLGAIHHESVGDHQTDTEKL
jgi:hypothetical protein